MLAQSIAAMPQKIQIPRVAENLELLPDLIPHMPVVRIYSAKTMLKGIHILQAELALPNALAACHHLYEPAPRGNVL